MKSMKNTPAKLNELGSLWNFKLSLENFFSELCLVILISVCMDIP